MRKHLLRCGERQFWPFIPRRLSLTLLLFLLAVNFNYQNLPNERVLFGKPFTIKLLSSAFNEF